MLNFKLFATFAVSCIFISACNQSNKNDSDADDETDTIVSINTTPAEDSIPVIAEQDHTAVREGEKEEMIVKYQFSGEVMKKGDAWVIRTNLEDKSITDYLPNNLAKEYQVEGLKVEFNGTPGEIPPNVRMAGRPFTITSIRKAG